MIKGKLVGLTAIEKKDLQQLAEWRNEPELRKNFREYREISMEMQNKWFEKFALNDNSQILFAVRSIEDDELLGCAGLMYIDFIDRRAELSLYIGYDNEYIDKKGYAEESCRLILNYGFNELGLNKIWTEIYEFDSKKMELLTNLKFKKDGVLRENHFYNGKFWNSVIFSKLASELNK